MYIILLYCFGFLLCLPCQSISTIYPGIQPISYLFSWWTFWMQLHFHNLQLLFSSFGSNIFIITSTLIELPVFFDRVRPSLKSTILRQQALVRFCSVVWHEATHPHEVQHESWAGLFDGDESEVGLYCTVRICGTVLRDKDLRSRYQAFCGLSSSRPSPTPSRLC